jgi:hypothetical protein
MKRKIGLAIAVVAIIAIIAGGKWAKDNLTVDLPEYPAIENVVWLPQHWAPEQRDWFYHADQGTQTFNIPYEWFTSLEQPSLSLGTPGLLSETTYLDRFGFIPSAATPGKPELPIGFAHGGQALDSSGAIWRNPQTNAVMTSLGLTCAACHTGRFTYGKTAVIVDGGPALTNVQNFQKAVILSILYTRYVPFRYERFAKRILGPGANDEAKKQLRRQFDTVFSDGQAFHKLEDANKAHSIDEGFARLDALTRIGNIVFAIDLPEAKNFLPYSAPVHYPRIWDAPWFLWVQYNGAIEQPMTRNAGEALGVGAEVKLTGLKEQLYSTSIQVKTVFELEQQLAGTQPNATSGFTGLNSPKWPEQILGPVDPDHNDHPNQPDLVAAGAVLYKKHCEGCHLPPVSDPAFWEVPQWSQPNAAGQRYLNLNMIDISYVGTDSAQAEDMMKRNVVVPDSLGIKNPAFGTALATVVDQTLNRWYDTQVPPIPPDVRDQMNGFRPDNARALLKYKARPLNGIWATPPYLHNGSVPNLYALLSPLNERPKTFYLGNREYDPVHVGYRTEKFPGGFEFDVSKRGNSNAGHEFNNGSGTGIIGPFLTPDERRALVEFLKTL